MAKNKSQEVATLTTSQLEQSGIKTNLTQNDVIEVVATEAYESMMKQIEQIKKFDSSVFNDYSKLDKQFLKKIHSYKHYSPSLNITEHDINHSNQSGERTHIEIYNFEVSEMNNSDKIKVYCNLKSISVATNATLKLYVHKYADDTKETINGFNYYSGNPRVEFSEIYNYKNPLSKEEMQSKADAYNEIVRGVYDSIPVTEKFDSAGNRYKTVSYDGFVKQARINVNRNIIKNQAPEVAEQINKLFGMEI